MRTDNGPIGQRDPQRGGTTSLETKSRWLDSLSSRLLLTCTIALAITMTVVSISVVMLFEHYTSDTIGPRHQLRKTQALIDNVHFDTFGNVVSIAVPELSMMWYKAFPDEDKYQLLDASGKVRLSSMQDGSAFPSNGTFNPDQSRADVLVGKQLFSVVTVAFERDGKRYYLQTAVTHRVQALDARERLRTVFGVVRISTIVALMIFAFAMRHTFDVMFRPLRRVSNEASDISPTNLGARLSLKQVPSEISPLIVAFNAVLERMEAGFKLQQSFLETTAHELQTPLTLMRAQVEMARQTGHVEPEQLLTDLDTMSRRVRQLLHLAEVSEPQNYHATQLDVANIAEDARHYLVERAHSVQVDIVIDGAALLGADKHKVWGDEAALFMLLKNLMENAIKASPPLSVVTVEVATDYISISDEGFGIPAEHLPHIFERFWRAPNSHEEGAGLGLSICQEIAAAHGWHLFVDMRVLHTRFVVAFDMPKHQSSAARPHSIDGGGLSQMHRPHPVK